MIKFISTKGGGSPVDFETAILDGYASDGGLYVPDSIPQITEQQLKEWSTLSYVDLAFEILSLFIDRSTLTEQELRQLLVEGYRAFDKDEVISLTRLKSRKDTYVMELFHGPTLSFKDIGMAFLINLVNFFLERKKERLTIVVATTGDTGPAAAYFAAGKPAIDAWLLYPKGMISEEQERQMTTLTSSNIHPVGVSNCPDGGDDLDLVISKLYANRALKQELKLSSVNSINWGRVMMQTVHYFYGYFRVIDRVGEQINMSVPCGAFGNLFAGTLARMMGLPIETFVVANNQNACLHRIFSQGIFSKERIFETYSSAIDILIPYNFWRYLYFVTGGDSEKIRSWMDGFDKTGEIHFGEEDYTKIKNGMLSASISNKQTLLIIREIWEKEMYLLDPHGAVSLASTDQLESSLDKKLICLATAHPAKFPNVILKSLDRDELPEPGTHQSIESAKSYCQRLRLCDHAHLEEALIHAMKSNWVGEKV